MILAVVYVNGSGLWSPLPSCNPRSNTSRESESDDTRLALALAVMAACLAFVPPFFLLPVLRGLGFESLVCSGFGLVSVGSVVAGAAVAAAAVSVVESSSTKPVRLLVGFRLGTTSSSTRPELLLLGFCLGVTLLRGTSDEVQACGLPS